MDDLTNSPQMRRILESKEARRRELAALPFPEKIAILVQLQERSSVILRTRGQTYRVWQLPKDPPRPPTP